MCVCVCVCVCVCLPSGPRICSDRLCVLHSSCSMWFQWWRKPNTSCCLRTSWVFRPLRAPGDRVSLVGGGVDYSPHRMSKADSTLGYPTLPHLANPSNETPPGPMHPSRPTSAASSVGYSKKIVRRSSVQLRKGTVTQVSSYWLAALQGHMTSRMRAFTWLTEISQSVRFGRALMGRTRWNMWTFTNLQCFTELI